MTHFTAFRPLLLGSALLFVCAGTLPVAARAQSAASIGGGHAGGAAGAGSTGASNPAIFGSGPAAGAPAGNGLGASPNAIAPPTGGVGAGTGGVGGVPNPGISNTVNPNGVPNAVPRPRPR